MSADVESLSLDGLGLRLPGPKSSYIEDDFRVAPELGLAMVSAGMGATGGQGHPSAKLAIWSVLARAEHCQVNESARERLVAGLN